MARQHGSPYQSSPRHSPYQTPFYPDHSTHYWSPSVYNDGSRRGSFDSTSGLSDYDSLAPTVLPDGQPAGAYGEDYAYSTHQHHSPYQAQLSPYSQGSPASAPVLLSSMDSVDWFGNAYRAHLQGEYSDRSPYSTQIRSAPPVHHSPSPMASPYSDAWQPLPALSETDLPFSFSRVENMELPLKSRSFRHQYVGSSSGSSEGEKKQCAHCQATSTPLWRREPGTLRLLCNACGLYLLSRNKHRPPELIAADRQEEPEPDPYYTGPECSHCKSRTTSVWRRSKDGKQLCNACGVYARMHGRDRPLSLRKNKVRPRSRS